MSRRSTRHYLRAIGKHAVLIAGVLMFTLPLVWMLAMSMKTDEELTDPSWLPRVPRFVARSPYVLGDVDVIKPLGVSDDAWDSMLPELTTMTREAVSRTIDANPPPTIERNHYRDAAASVVLNRLVPRIPADAWNDGQAAATSYRERLSDDAIKQALTDRLARFELRGLLLRTVDAHVIALCNTNDVAKRWRVESGDATIETDSSGQSYLQYDFAKNDSPIVLRFDFDSPVQPELVHRLLMSYVADNSWHRVEMTLEMHGRAWKSDRSSPLAQHRVASFLIQPPGFEDRTFMPRKWIPMTAIESRRDVNRSTDSSLRLIIQPSSTARAIVEKIRYNYGRAFRQVPVGKYIFNSALLVGLSVLGTAFSSTFVAYAFARLSWPGRSISFILLLATMMLPGQVTMIPSFMIWRQLGWYNTLTPLWVPNFLGVAFFIFLMVQFMKTIPRDLEEAARIDGLNAVQTWYYIILPLVKPAAAAIAIMTAIGAWNEFMGPLVYLRDQSRFPLSLGLFGMRADMATGGVDWTMLMASNILMTLPVIAVFLVGQKYFVQGMTMSGLKG